MAGLDLGMDSLARIGRIPGLDSGNSPNQRSRAAYRQPLPPEEFESIGRKALNVGASGLSHVVGVLDKPGQAVRGVIAGKGVNALKNLVPFSDTMGLTTEKDHTSGRDLTDKFGITQKYDKGWGAWGAGLAADMLTDPLTYVGGIGPKHALTDVGKAVQKTGALKGWTGRQLIEGFQDTAPSILKRGGDASDVTHALDKGLRVADDAAVAAGAEAGKPLSGLLRVGIPFGPGATLGTGQTAQGVAGAMDSAGNYLRYGNPIGRAAGALFDPSVHGAVDRITQEGATRYKDPALQKLQAQGRRDTYQVISQLDPIIKAGVHPEAMITDAARAVAEGAPHLFPKDLVTQVQPTADLIRENNARRLAMEQAAGAGTKDVTDPYVNYVHRSSTPERSASLQMGGKKGAKNEYPLTAGSDFGRDPLFVGVPGGFARINDWFSRFAGTKDVGGIQAAVRKELEDDLVMGGRQMTPKIGKAFDEKAAEMAERLSRSNVRYNPTELAKIDPTRKADPFFTPDLVGDETQRAAQHTKKFSNAQTITGMIGDNARPITPGDGLIPVPDVLRRLGMKTLKADAEAGTPMTGGLVQAYRALAKQGAGKVDPFLMGPRKALKAEVAKFGMTPEHVEQIAKQYGKWNAPEPIKAPIRFLDSFTNAFRALTYPLWPAAHVRNWGNAVVNNTARSRVGLPEYGEMLKVMTGRGKQDLSSIHPSLAGLSPEQQIDWLRREYYATAHGFGGGGMADEIAGTVPEALETGKRFTPFTPGSDRTGPTGNLLGDAAHLIGKQGILDTLGALGKAALHPKQAGQHLGIRGVGGAAKDTLPAVKAGWTLGANVEDGARLAQWIKELKGGATPEMAAEMVHKTHFDYSRLTDFEKNFMRRMVPFYTFASRNLPLQLDTLLHNPRLISAQLKPFSQPDPDKGYVPQYLNSGIAIPTGPEKDGQRQYISKLGLGPEEAFERLHFKNGLPDIRSTALDYMGQLNPIVKGPLEQLMNTQFYTQRKLSDLKAPQAASAIGRLFGDENPQVLSQVFANSPLTRFVSSADKILDNRKSLGQKALNLLSGVRVTDVDADRQRAIDRRNAIQALLDEQPNLSRYTNFYVKPEDVSKLTPEEIELMRAYTQIQDEGKRYAKEQRQRIGVR